MTTTTQQPTWTEQNVKEAVAAVLNQLEPVTAVQTQAMAAFTDGDSQQLKDLAATHLDDSLIRSLGYLISAPKLTPNTSTILAEAARAAADHIAKRARERAIAEMQQCFKQAIASA